MALLLKDDTWSPFLWFRGGLTLKGVFAISALGVLMKLVLFAVLILTSFSGFSQEDPIWRTYPSSAPSSWFNKGIGEAFVAFESDIEKQVIWIDRHLEDLETGQTKFDDLYDSLVSQRRLQHNISLNLGVSHAAVLIAALTALGYGVWATHYSLQQGGTPMLPVTIYLPIPIIYLAAEFFWRAILPPTSDALLFTGWRRLGGLIQKIEDQYIAHAFSEGELKDLVERISALRFDLENYANPKEFSPLLHKTIVPLLVKVARAVRVSRNTARESLLRSLLYETLLLQKSALLKTKEFMSVAEGDLTAALKNDPDFITKVRKELRQVSVEGEDLFTDQRVLQGIADEARYRIGNGELARCSQALQRFSLIQNLGLNRRELAKYRP